MSDQAARRKIVALENKVEDLHQRVHVLEIWASQMGQLHIPGGVTPNPHQHSMHGTNCHICGLWVDTSSTAFKCSNTDCPAGMNFDKE